MKLFTLIDRFIDKLSTYSLVIAIAVILVLAIANIVLRWFSITFLWVEPLIRHLVFLSAFLGGALATGRKTHIGIDILGKYFEAKGMLDAHRWVGRMIALASFLTLVVLVHAGWDFVLVEAKYGKNVFLGVHSKFLVAIIPLGFSLIAYRFFYIFLETFNKSSVIVNEGKL